MTIETLPEYLSLEEDERGDSLGLDWESYRYLARTALRITAGHEAMMGIYRLANGQGCALDLWFAGATDCLTIVVNFAENQLCLLSSPMDSAAGVSCLLNADNSDKSWRKLLRLARQEIKA